MKLETKSRIIVFILAWLFWVALTLEGGTQEIIVGFFIALLVSLIAGRFLITTVKQKSIFRRIFFAVIYIFVFLWEMIKANIHVAYIVINPILPIKPGIIKIRTNLTKESAITVLGNSITLTPGTFTIDLNPDKKELYIHCITVLSKDTEENTKNIGRRFEKLLTEVFE